MISARMRLRTPDLNRSANELVVDDPVDEVATFGVEGLTRDAERIEALRGRDGDDDVGVGQEVAASVVDGDDALADVAGAVGDDGGGCELMWPCQVWVGLASQAILTA